MVLMEMPADKVFPAADSVPLAKFAHSQAADIIPPADLLVSPAVYMATLPVFISAPADFSATPAGF